MREWDRAGERTVSFAGARSKKKKKKKEKKKGPFKQVGFRQKNRPSTQLVLEERGPGDPVYGCQRLSEALMSGGEDSERRVRHSPEVRLTATRLLR